MFNKKYRIVEKLEIYRIQWRYVFSPWWVFYREDKHMPPYETASLSRAMDKLDFLIFSTKESVPEWKEVKIQIERDYVR